MQPTSFQFSATRGISTTHSLSAPSGNTESGCPVVATAAPPTIATYAEHWLEGVRGAVRSRTFESYSAQLRLHVIPTLGHRLITDVDVDDVLVLIDELRAAGYTGWTIRTALTPLSRLLNHAVRRNVIPVNPITRLDRTERPAVWASEQKILKREDIGRLLDGAPPRFRSLLATAVFTGLRQGELLGLTWAEIDFDDAVVKVRSSLNREGVRQEPKTRKAIRDVVMMPALARTLAIHRATSRFAAPNDFVFASERGTPLYWRNVARRALQPALRNAGLPHLRWHDLRHTFASLLIAEGANIVYVSRQLGHGSSDITLRCYSHLFDRAEHAQRTRDALERSFGELLDIDLSEALHSRAQAASKGSDGIG
jgi:integrase